MKIATKDIKKFITKWVSTDKMKAFLADTYLNNASQEDMRYYSTEFRCKENKTTIHQEIINRFCANNNWRRDFKFKCDEFDADPKIDIDGFVSPKLKNYNIKYCIKRSFFQRVELFRDTFMIEVITDPKDQIILFWTLVNL